MTGARVLRLVPPAVSASERERLDLAARQIEQLAALAADPTLDTDGAVARQLAHKILKLRGRIALRPVPRRQARMGAGGR